MDPMDPLVVIVPSRGRPQNIARLMEAWVQTDATATLWVVVDNDDPTADAYHEVLFGGSTMPDWLACTFAPRIRLGPTLNREAIQAADDYPMIGFMGDDHLPRTLGWDEMVRSNLAKTGIVYGNDLLQRDTLPTAVFMTSDIVRALGYMVPPPIIHMYADNVWRDWGQAMRRFTYLPDMVIEHIHWVNGKVESDEGYGEANGRMGPDGEAYNLYRYGDGFAADSATLKELVAG